MGALDWLSKYEAIAVWLEGAALLAIFVWDRIEHREATKASHNAERAWVMTELDWPESGRGELRLCEGTSRVGNQEPVEETSLTVRLICRNDGRSPAWIDRIEGYAEIYSNKDQLADPKKHKLHGFGTVGPLAPNREKSRIVHLMCPGHMKKGEFISVFIRVQYRDIFGFQRETFLGYVVQDFDTMALQEGLPERNRNT